MVSLSLPAKAFSVAPARLTITADAGSRALVKLTVSNPDTFPITITPRVVGVKQDEAGRTTVGKWFDEAENWVNPETSGLKIAPGKKRQIIFSVAPPIGTSPGSHYVGLAIAARPVGPGALQLSGEVISLLTIQVSGVVNERLEIVNWETPFWISPGKNATTTIALYNRGTIEVPVVGQFRVTSLRGQEIFSQSLPIGNKIVAGSTRRVAPKVAMPATIITPGPYWVELQLRYGITQQTVTRSKLAWYLPLWSVVCVSSLVIGLVFLFIITRRHPSA